MSRTFVRQDTQIRKSDVYDDTIAATLANFETNPVNLEEDLNTIRSQLHNLLKNQAGNWYDDLNVPVTLDTGSQRGVNDLNSALHLIEKKRVLRDVYNLTDITVPATQNYVILTLAQLPANTTAAVGAVSTLGTVVAAHGGSFGTAHSLTEVAGPNAVSPKNLMQIVDGATRDPILSSGRIVYGLLQTENATDGHTMTGTTPNRAQISFVRVTAAGDDLEACPVADIESHSINYSTRERVRLEDLSESDFLRGAVIDTPSTSTVTRQSAYDNQGTTPVEVTTNSTLDLNSAGIFWEIRDLVNATLFRITEGSTGGTTTLLISTDVDTFDSTAQVNDFDQGIRVDTGGQRINVGETAGLIESTGANDLRILGAGELYLDDGNQTGSTWAQTAGIKLSDTTAEWDAFETHFGEVSLLNAIVQAKKKENRTKGVAVVTVNTAADTDVGGVGGGTNLDAQLPAYNHVASFVDDVDVYLNGVLMRNGADSSANHDVYPGTSPTNGQIKFEFNVKAGGNPDVITMIVWGEP